MDDPVAVSVIQSLGHVGRDPNRVLYAQLRVLLDPFTERLPLHVRHHVVEEAVRFTGVEEGQDVRMLEIGSGLDLSEEALGPDGRGQLGVASLVFGPTQRF